MKTISFGLDGYSIRQIPNHSHSQMMSYLITAPGGGLIAVDGGVKDDAETLCGEIKKSGGVVDAWLITHAHLDHIDALTEILNRFGEISIRRIYFDFPPRKWLAAVEPQDIGSVDAFLDAAGRFRSICFKPEQGTVLTADGLKIEVLTDARRYAAYDNYNDTSVVYRFLFPHASALFLGDLGEKGGKHLAEKYGARLKSDIVQMAHHGQNGVAENVYQKIAPAICLWPTPKWLWENDSGHGPDSGPWKTLITREWIKKLHVKQNAAMFEGEYMIV